MKEMETTDGQAKEIATIGQEQKRERGMLDSELTRRVKRYVYLNPDGEYKFCRDFINAAIREKLAKVEQ